MGEAAESGEPIKQLLHFIVLEKHQEKYSKMNWFTRGLRLLTV